MLKELRSRFDTDKSNEYLANYERLFTPLASQPVVMLELGVFRGGSLLLWQEFFPRGTIVGLDLKVPSLPKERTPRAHLYQGSQDDLRLLDEIARTHAPQGFDIVIDDASHQGELTRKSFWHLFDHHLKPGGIYAIEDWGTGYWPSWVDGAAYQGPSHCAGMVGFVKELVDECCWADVSHPKLGVGSPRQSKIQQLQLNVGHAIVIKR